jgi:hypothetical protein
MAVDPLELERLPGREFGALSLAKAPAKLL